MEHVQAAELFSATTETPPQVWMERYKKCACINQTSPSEMKPEEIKEEIIKILFDENFRKKCDASDRELLTIVIVKDKVLHFEFLKAYTTWKVTGLWDKEKELNAQIDIEFRDNAQECLGNRLMHLLYEYNKMVVKEELLYARTAPIEEGTLFP